MRLARLIPLADQVMSNASNLLFTVLVAGLTAPATFGRFAVAYSVLTFGVAAWRNGLGYQVSMKAGDWSAVQEESNRAVWATLAITPAFAVVVLAVAGIGQSASAELAWGLAVATPFVLVQDLLRYAAVAARRTSAALVSDSVWTVLLLVALTLRILGRLDVTTLISLWVAGSVIAAATLLWALRITPLVRGTGAWVRTSWRGRAHLIGGGLIAGASVPITAGIVALVAGPEVAAGIAGAGMLMAPVNSLVAWMSLTLLATAVVQEESRQTRVFVRVGLGVAGLAAIWGLALLLVPATIGQIVLGQAWAQVAQALPVVWLQHGLAVTAATGNLYLISIRRTQAVFGNQVVVAISRTALGWIAAGTFATVLAAATAETLAMAIWLGAVLWYLGPGRGHPSMVPTATVV